jgi:hypothetical protein
VLGGLDGIGLGYLLPVLLGGVLFDTNGICREGGNEHGPRKAVTPEDEGEYSQAKSRAA